MGKSGWGGFSAGGILARSGVGGGAKVVVAAML